MQFFIVGLGNPGDEYIHHRHNAGRLAVEAFDMEKEFGGFVEDSKTKSNLSKGTLGKHTVSLLLPNTFMNKSGSAVKDIIKKPKNLIVVHDDIDLPFGSVKLSFGRGSGGHKGVESVIKAIKTKDFVRVRIGVAPTTLAGKIKKPKGESHVHDFLLGDFSKKEMSEFPKLFKKINVALKGIVIDGRVKAMNVCNGNN